MHKTKFTIPFYHNFITSRYHDEELNSQKEKSLLIRNLLFGADYFFITKKRLLSFWFSSNIVFQPNWKTTGKSLCVATGPRAVKLTAIFVQTQYFHFIQLIGAKFLPTNATVSD